MENFLSLLESVDSSWLTPSSTTWAMDMIFAFVCGLGFFHLLLPFLPLDSPSPPPAENTTTKKVVNQTGRKSVRKKIRTLEERWSCLSPPQGNNDSYGAYRGSRKKTKEDKVLGSHPHSMQERLVNTTSICQDSGQDASGEAFKPDAAKAHLPPRQPTQESVATNSSLETSSAPRNEHLLLQDSKPLSPVLLDSSSTESQFSVSASWPPETLTGRHHSPPQQRAPSYPSHPLDPVACPPPMLDPSMAAPELEWKILATSQSTPLQVLSSPMPTTPRLNLPKRPTSTTRGLNYSSRSTSTQSDLEHLNRPSSINPSLDHSSRPTSTSPGRAHLSRPTSTSPGRAHLSRPTSTAPGRAHLSRPTSTSPGCAHLSRPTSTSPGRAHLSRPTSTAPGRAHLSRPTSTSPGRAHLSRPTSTAPGRAHLSRPTSTAPGRAHLSRPTSTSPGRAHLSRPTSTSPGRAHLSRPTSTSPGRAHLSRPTSTSPGRAHLSRPTSTSPGRAHLSRPSSGFLRHQVATNTSYHSNLTCDESLQEDLSLTIHEASFRTGPTHWQIETGEPSFINCDVQEMLEVEISKRVQLNLRKEKEKGRSDLCWLHSWNSKQDNITLRLFCTKNCKSEQFSAHQKILGNDLKETYSQLFWGHPILHSESLVATVSMAGASLHHPSILFNVNSTYSPLQDQTKDPPQLCPPQPLLHHAVKSPPLNPKFSWSRSPPETRIQTQAHNPSPLSKLPCDSAATRDDGGFCPTTSGTHVIVPPAVEHLERHLLKKYRETMSDLPVMVKDSQEAFNQQVSNSWVSQGQGAALHLQGKFISPKLWPQMEKYLKKTIKQHQGQGPHKVQLSLDLDQAQVNHRTSCPSALANESSQHPQSVSLNGPEILQPWGNPHQDPTKCLGRTLKKPLYRRLEGFETISETEEETCHIRHPRSDVPSVSPVTAGKEELKGTPRNHSNDEGRQTNDTMLPKGTCRVIYLDHESVPPKISKPNMANGKKPSLDDLTTSKETNNGTFVLDPGIQNVLDAHIERRLVRHRWSLPLRGLKTKCDLNMKASTTLPFPQSSNASLPLESRDNSIIQMVSALGEPFKNDPEKEGTEEASTVESQSSHNCPSVLHRNGEFMREVPPGNNSGSFEAPTTAQRDNVTSVQEFSVSSQSSKSRDIRELVETEEEEPCDWINPLEAGELGNIDINEFLESSGSLSSPSESCSQDAEDSGQSTPHCSAGGFGLQECAIAKFCQDWVPKVLFAAEILVSSASESSFKVASFTTESPFEDMYPVSKNSKPGKQKHSHTFVSNNQKETSRKPKQGLQVKGTTPAQGNRSNNENFGDRIKSFIGSILSPKYKVKETSNPKCKGLPPPMTRSQPSVTGKLFMPVAEQVAEGLNLTTCVSKILKKELGVPNSCVPPNPVSGPRSHHSILPESKKTHGNSTVHQANVKVHSQPAQDKGMPCGNKQAQVPSRYQRRAHVPHVPRMPVHCPRHCPYRNILQ